MRSLIDYESYKRLKLNIENTNRNQFIILLFAVRVRSISGAKHFARKTRSTFPKSPPPTKRSLASRAPHSSFPARCHLFPRRDRCQFIPASSHRVAIMALGKFLPPITGPGRVKFLPQIMDPALGKFLPTTTARES